MRIHIKDMKANKQTRAHAKTYLARKTANEKEGRIKWQIGEGGEKNRRKMANNVSAER
jgi:hypothetical protein